MKGTGFEPPAVRKPGWSAGRLAKLHDTLLGKLRNDRVRLTIIAARLSRGGDTARVLEDIRSLAQGVRAEAATFGAAEVSAAAHGLEQAVDAKSGLHSNNLDADVWVALENLRDLLGGVSGVSRAW
jgi:HPt (histidine-containing phosphotransfer) domain-containing protein